MDIKKHVGRLKNTDRRIVVVYIQIPNKEDHALVVDTDALPDRFHDALMQVIDSVEGQQATSLSSVLSRRILPDTGQDIMNALHHMGFLQAQPISNIMMYPRPNMPMPLEDIIKMMKMTPDEAKADVELSNRSRFEESKNLDNLEQRESIAKNLLIQAQSLKAEADKKLAEAYALAPHLQLKGEAESTKPTPQEVIEVLKQDEAVQERVVHQIDVSDLPPDVASAYVAAIQAEPYVAPEVVEESAGHQIDVNDDPRLQAFLDRAAFREDKEKAATEPVVKRPVGRPKKNAG